MVQLETRTHTASRDGRFNVLAEACPTRQVINRIGDRWSLLVLYALERETLRNLERDGLVHREVFAAVPPRVEYRLTPLGQSLTKRIRAIREWAYEHMDDIDAARAQFDGAD
jgi:DNA-binding HxlR family transcriptional regulator